MHHIHIDLHRIPFLKNELSEIYSNLLIASFALSMLNILLPVYLLTVGFSVQHVLLFYAFYFGFLACFAPVSALIANRLGFKHVIVLRLPILIFFLLGMYTINFFGLSLLFLVFLGIIYGISDSMYWISLNSLFARNSKKLSMGSEVSRLWASAGIAAIAGPAIGGFIAVVFGFPVLFVMTSTLLFASVFPLFYTKDVKPHVKFSTRRMLVRKNIRFLMGFAAIGIKNVAGYVLWPILVYIILKDVLAVGFVGTLTAVGIFIFTLIVGKMADNKKRRHLILKISALSMAVLWFLRIYVSTGIEIYLISLFTGFFLIMGHISFDAFSFDRARQTRIDEFLVFREFGFGLGRIFLLVLLMFVADIFVTGFSIAGIASIGLLLF